MANSGVLVVNISKILIDVAVFFLVRAFFEESFTAC